MSAQPTYVYRAVATDAAGRSVVETFDSNVEYLAGDELPLSSARWRVDSVGGEILVKGSNRVTRVVRELHCQLVV